ncbi:MAG: Ig-like domain-containing protein, partial [Terriglobales bacterium]
MAIERMLVGKKLPLTLAFTVLLVFAFGVSCKGFFQPPTLTSITINPTGPTVQVGSDVSLSAFGVNSEGTGATLTSGVSWSSSDPTIAQITGSCATEPCGGVSVLGVAAGQVTITAGDESVTNTATLNVILPGVTNFEVCEGVFGATTTCSSGSTPLKWTVSGTNGGQMNFVAQGTANGTEFDLTTQSTWTLVA